MRDLILIVVFCMAGTTIIAQELIIPDTTKTTQENIDEILNSSDSLETSRKAPKDLKGPFSMFAGTPGRAALYSLVLPGAGQAFNEKYWKVPIVWAAEGVAIGVLIYNSKSYNQWNKSLSNVYTVPRTDDVYNDGRTANEVLNIRNRRRKYRDYSIISVVLIHFIQVADAFVNRHLIEFDVSDDLSLEIGTSGAMPSVGFIATF